MGDIHLLGRGTALENMLLKLSQQVSPSFSTALSQRMTGYESLPGELHQMLTADAQKLRCFASIHKTFNLRAENARSRNVLEGGTVFYRAGVPRRRDMARVVQRHSRLMLM
jgi:hypothetical protein